MKLKELIARALRREELNALERAELEAFDPDSLQAKLDELERAKLSREEALQRDLDAAVSERETLRGERDRLVRRERLAAIAARYGCLDPEYLDFRAGRENVALDDERAVGDFVARMAKESPHCFATLLKPGAGVSAAAAAAAPNGGAPSGRKDLPDRICGIVEALNAAPESV